MRKPKSRKKFDAGLAIEIVKLFTAIITALTAFLKLLQKD